MTKGVDKRFQQYFILYLLITLIPEVHLSMHLYPNFYLKFHTFNLWCVFVARDQIIPLHQRKFRSILDHPIYTEIIIGIKCGHT